MSLPLKASGPAGSQWNRVCQVSTGHELQVTMANGERVTGYCMSVDVEGMSISTPDHKVVKIARATLTRLEMSRAKGNQVRSSARHAPEFERWFGCSFLAHGSRWNRLDSRKRWRGCCGFALLSIG